jgi:hypothetical protein
VIKYAHTRKRRSSPNTAPPLHDGPLSGPHGLRDGR